MAEETKESNGCAGCIISCAFIFMVGYGLYFLCAMFLGPGGFISSVISIALLLLFMGCLKFFVGK